MDAPTNRKRSETVSVMEGQTKPIQTNQTDSNHTKDQVERPGLLAQGSYKFFSLLFPPPEKAAFAIPHTTKDRPKKKGSGGGSVGKSGQTSTLKKENGLIISEDVNKPASRAKEDPKSSSAYEISKNIGDTSIEKQCKNLMESIQTTLNVLEHQRRVGQDDVKGSWGRRSKNSDDGTSPTQQTSVEDTVRDIMKGVIDQYNSPISLLSLLVHGAADLEAFNKDQQTKNIEIMKLIDNSLSERLHSELIKTAKELKRQRVEYMKEQIEEFEKEIKEQEILIKKEETEINEEEACLGQLKKEIDKSKKKVEELKKWLENNRTLNHTFSCKKIIVQQFAEYHAENLDSGPINMPHLRGINPTVEVNDDRSVACRLFNENPKKGFQYLVDKFLISNTPDLVDFLFRNEDLDKEKIGEFLGENAEINITTLDAFMKKFDFADLDFDIALRQVLYTFRLPGEAQKIDRIIERFANRFFDQNPASVFKTPEAAWALAFAVIMLNTDAHNPVVKKKMTKAQFIHNCRDINDGEDFPDFYLSEIYDRIVTDEIRMKQEGLYSEALKKGWIVIKATQSGKHIIKWKRYWVILLPKAILYFKKPTVLYS